MAWEKDNHGHRLEEGRFVLIISCSGPGIGSAVEENTDQTFFCYVLPRDKLKRYVAFGGIDSRG